MTWLWVSLVYSFVYSNENNLIYFLVTKGKGEQMSL